MGQMTKSTIINTCWPQSGINGQLSDPLKHGPKFNFINHGDEKHCYMVPGMAIVGLIVVWIQKWGDANGQ